VDECKPLMDGCHNVWIVKPAGKSRGRGIQCFNNHADIVKYTQIREAVAVGPAAYTSPRYPTHFDTSLFE